VAAIAGAFCPNRFDATSETSWFLFTPTSTGCTVAACAASKAAAVARSCCAVCDTCPAAVLSHPANGAAPAAIDTAAGPCHA
jgi:hypothetical protein